MINLLPTSYKKEIRLEERFRLVLILGMLGLIFFICLSLSLLAIRVYIAGEIQAQQIVAESQRGEQEKERIEQIRKLNQEIASVVSFYEKRTSFFDVLERVSSALPQPVFLTSLSYTPGTPKGKVALKGFAPRTEDLLELQANLERDSVVENLQIPPSDWARATDINFSLEFEL